MAGAYYRPILLTRRGERSALADTSGAVKSTMNPVFVVEPIDWNYDDDLPAKTIDQHLAKKAPDLVQTWGTTPAAVDLLFHDDRPMDNGEHPLLWLTREARSLGLPLTPAVGLNRSAPYVAAAAAVAARDGDGLTLRLSLEEWPMSVGVATLDGLLTTLGVNPSVVDLVLDLGAEVVAAPRLALTATQAQLSTLPYLTSWRSITVAGAGFPKTLGGLPKTVNVIDRPEWALYLQVLVGGPTRVPMFGDYVIAHPDPLVDVNPAFMSISAALRYTVDDAWLVPKGELFKGQGGSGQGGAAVTPLAQTLIARPEFMGAGHCSMEDWAGAVAAGANGGNPEQWRKHGTRHHLQVVSDQMISTLGVPSTGP